MSDTVLSKYVSRKLLVTVLALVGLFWFGQYEAAAALASAYVLGQGAVDALDTYSYNKGQAEVQATHIASQGE